MKRLARYLRTFLQRPVVQELDALRAEVRAIRLEPLRAEIHGIRSDVAAQAQALAALAARLETNQNRVSQPPASRPIRPAQSILDVSLAGLDFKLDNAVGNDNVALQAEKGTFEAPLPALLAELLARLDGAFVDVGAHNGLYSILACLVRPDATIVAFEPVPVILDVLRRNLEINGLSSRVDLRPFALSDQSGIAQMYIPNPSHGLLETSASLEPDFRARHSVIEVPVRTLDELKLEGPIAIIKVDIEGHEHAFLAGARQTIARDRPIIIAEALPGARFDRLQEFLISDNYRDFRLRRDIVINDYQVRFDRSAWNHALIPVERLEMFQAACATQKLEIVVREPESRTAERDRTSSRPGSPEKKDASAHVPARESPTA